MARRGMRVVDEAGSDISDRLGTMYHYTGYRPPESFLERMRWFEPCEPRPRWQQAILNRFCRVMGWNYYWYRGTDGRCHLHLADDNRSAR